MDWCGLIMHKKFLQLIFIMLTAAIAPSAQTTNLLSFTHISWTATPIVYHLAISPVPGGWVEILLHCPLHGDCGQPAYYLDDGTEVLLPKLSTWPSGGGTSQTFGFSTTSSNPLTIYIPVLEMGIEYSGYVLVAGEDDP
jgi:hypothetical protein